MTLGKNIYIILLFLIGVSTYSNAQEKIDSIVVSQDIYDEIDTFSSFDSNLDSLSSLWYVKQSLAAVHCDSVVLSGIDSMLIPEFPDSVVIARLAELNSMIDLAYNDRVKAFMKVYTHKERDRVEVMLGLADYYFPLFEQILIDEGLPIELKYLPVIESALNPRAVSRVGATGLWQFMYSTGKMYKLEINSYVDERRDPIKASYAAAAFLKDLHEMFGDWTLAIAAYNCGPGNVRKAIRRTGGKTNFWDIYYRLPRETRGYVPAFIAATYTMNYYNEHNLIPKPIELNLAVDTIMISEELHLKQVAEVLQVPVQMLRDMNPQYKTDIIPARTKKYALKVPADLSGDFIAMQDSIFAYHDEIYFNPDKKLKSPTTHAYYGAPPKNSSKLIYKVKTGDNLGYIASWYGVGVSEVRHWNNIYRNLIKVGQRITIYVPANKKEYYDTVSKLSFAEKQARIGKKVKVKSTVSSTKSNADGSAYHYYTVRSGDNLWTIAQKYDGVTHTDLKRLNNISDHRNLVVGQKLRIKKKG
jgi:membrane-bound lytic murein transglycosylase D